MKMKELSALTGISDRTIRYYIDDGLFVPEKQLENYTGRKKYDFNEKDVEQLKKIALLREYDFSTGIIKQLLNESADISDILEMHITESKESVDKKSDKISALEKALANEPKDLNELCKALEMSVKNKRPIPAEAKQTSRWKDTKLILRAIGIIALWIFAFKASNEFSAFKFLSLTVVFIIPLLLDTVAFILEVTEKHGIVRALSVILRIVMAVVFLFGLYSFYSVWNNNENKAIENKLYSSISAKELVGIAEDENTIYIIDNKETNLRPEADRLSFPAIGNNYGFYCTLGMELPLPDKDYMGRLDVSMLYCEKIGLQKLLYSMEQRDVKKYCSHNYNESNRETFETDDGYKCSSYYIQRNSEGNNWYSVVITGNGQFLAVRLDAAIKVDFDEMNIDEYYLKLLREMSK